MERIWATFKQPSFGPLLGLHVGLLFLRYTPPHGTGTKTIHNSKGPSATLNSKPLSPDILNEERKTKKSEPVAVIHLASQSYG